MSDVDFTATMNQLTHLYDQGNFVEALDLVQRKAASFPQQGLMYHWTMCVAARADQPAIAVEALREALAHGYWYPARFLRDDEDLKSLQGVPDYEELVAVSLERLAEAESGSKPELLVVPGQEGAAAPAPLLIGLHGNLQNARVAANDWRQLHTRGWALAFPQSSQMFTTDAYMWDDFDQGTADVERLCSEFIGRPSVDPERVILGGFSLGGGLAIHLALSGAIKARGFLVIGPYLRDPEALAPFLETARANGVRGYIIMGLQEPPEALELMQRIVAFLRENGIACELERHPEIAHAFPPDFSASLEKALAFLLPG